MHWIDEVSGKKKQGRITRVFARRMPATGFALTRWELQQNELIRQSGRNWGEAICTFNCSEVIVQVALLYSVTLTDSIALCVLLTQLNICDVVFHIVVVGRRNKELIFKAL